MDGPPGNGRPISRSGHVLRVGSTVAVAGLVLIGCSTASTSLSSASTLNTVNSSTVLVELTTTTIALTAATVAESTSTIPTSTLPTPTTVVATSPPETTLPPETTAPADTATAPPETAVPATTLPAPTPTTPPAAGCIACQPNYVFAYDSHFSVPQLGTEPVRGTGCGADGSLGPAIPDGIWDGFIKISATTLTIDVQCVYFGASAAPFIAACEAEHDDDDDDCREKNDDFWTVNNNPRTRTVALDPGFRRRYEASGCVDPGPGKGARPQIAGNDDRLDSWLIIENGKATFALTSCVYG